MNRFLKTAFVLPLFFCIILFLLLFFRAKNTAPPPPDNISTEPEAVANEVISESLDEYFLIAEDDYLNLYEEASLKHSEPLNSRLLPHSDITALAKGIHFSSIEDAYAMMESYIN